MFLTSSNLVYFLISRKLARLSTIVDGSFCVTELGRRNRNFIVKLESNRTLFVKQTKASDAQSLLSLKREIGCYEFAQSFPLWNQYLPHVFDIDRERHSLVLEFLQNSESLTQYHWRIHRFSNLIADRLGSALADFHKSAPVSNVTPEFFELFSRKPVWILRFDRVSNSSSGGAKELLATIQQSPAISDGFRVIEQEWKFNCLIHGDMKWDNCLIYPDELQTPKLKIIDWELIDAGDARWDFAGLMHSFFVFWIELDQRSSENEPANDIEQLIARENRLQNNLRQCLMIFLRSYLDNLGERDGERMELKLTMQFVAARLILTCYEGVCHSETMSKNMTLILQLARIIFERPEQMVTHFFPQLMDSHIEGDL